MPQFDISTYVTQIFWVVVVFSVFWFTMDRLILPKIRDIVEERKKRYNDLVLKTEKISKKAFEALNEYNEMITAAKEKAAEEIKQKELELKEIIEKKEEEFEKKLEEKIKDSRDKLEKEKKEILGKVEDLAEVVAFNITQKMDIKNITIEDIKEISVKRLGNE